jgi:hypothetical protein
LSFPSVAAAQDDRGELLMQVQGADVLSDMLTYTRDRADARVTAMQEFLGSIDKTSAYQSAAPKMQESTPVYFAQVFQGAVAFVKEGGAQYADQSLKNLNQSQLLNHLTVLQAYNVDQFRKLTAQRQSSNAMAAYLESINQFDAYLKWAKAKAPNATPQQAAPKTPEEIAERMRQTLATSRDVAWSKAQAMGLSQEEFDKRWEAHLKEYKESVADRVKGMGELAGSLGKSQVAGTGEPAQAAPAPSAEDVALGAVPVKRPVIWQGQLNIIQPPPGPALPPPVQSKYTNAYFHDQASKGLWNDWDDNYGDVPHHHH